MAGARRPKVILRDSGDYHQRLLMSRSASLRQAESHITKQLDLRFEEGRLIILLIRISYDHIIIEGMPGVFGVGDFRD